MPSLAYGKLRNYAVRICHMGPFAAKEVCLFDLQDVLYAGYLMTYNALIILP